jgi:phenylpropionate dioxygenase-like ring-hydroxylating dioxygenase large terminal subunit
VPRVGSYRGFLFVTLNPNVPDLDQHLGRAKHYIDIFCDRSPTGAIEVTKPLKYEYAGNWKLQMENMSDGYHAQFVHASAFGTRYEPNPDDDTADRPQRGRVERSFGPGHGVMGWWTPDIIANKQANPKYFAALVERLGEERAEELAHLNIHLMVWPNLILHTNYAHIRVVRPLAVDHTEINTYPCRFVGAPDDLNAALVKATALHVSPAGRVQIDDLEVFGRVTGGLRSEGIDWVLFKMRGPDEHLNEYGELESNCLGEMIPRGYYREWLRLMTQE